MKGQICSNIFIFIKVYKKMGNCTTGSNGSPYEAEDLAKYKSFVDEKQLQLLKLVYEDLAQRIKENALSIENFLLFFHKTGEWGDQLFKQFDTNSSKFISEEQFIKGIVRIYKTTEEHKIELLFKFFSGQPLSKNSGISFRHFLTMLYNYPKEDIKNILNDQDFVNKELKQTLRAISNNKYRGRRLQSFYKKQANSQEMNGMKFQIDESDSAGSQRIESKLGTELIRSLNKKADMTSKETTLKISLGKNNVEIKTASIHHLVKKMARSIFKEYNIDEKAGKLKFEQFSDWIKKHKNLYHDYYKGFHNEAWELDPESRIPMYLVKEVEMNSKARYIREGKAVKISLHYLNSVLIVCEEKDAQTPVMIICLEGLIVRGVFDESNGNGIEINHRDGQYPTKQFFFINKELRDRWIEDHLQYYKGASISQKYEIGQKIGVGKFSIVYKAKQKETGEDFAVKFIESYKLDAQSRNLIAHESYIMSVFQHPLLVGYKQSIKTKNQIYIITELVNGKDLFQFVKDLKYLNEPQAAFIIQQLISGVRYLHSLGIVHRDLKPENIMIEYNEVKKQIGKVKIIDFGFANYLPKLSTEELLAGTPNYIAPEVLRKEEINEKIDNFAIGSVMYFVLSGNAPFNSHDVTQVLEKTLDGAYVINDKRWKHISEAAKDLVQKLLDNEPESRISLDEALRHPWFREFPCVGGSCLSVKNHQVQ